MLREFCATRCNSVHSQHVQEVTRKSHSTSPRTCVISGKTTKWQTSLVGQSIRSRKSIFSPDLESCQLATTHKAMECFTLYIYCTQFAPMSQHMELVMCAVQYLFIVLTGESLRQTAYVKHSSQRLLKPLSLMISEILNIFIFNTKQLHV